MTCSHGGHAFDEELDAAESGWVDLSETRPRLRRLPGSESPTLASERVVLPRIVDATVSWELKARLRARADAEGATMAAVNLIGLSYRKVKGISKETGNREMQYGITTTGPAYLKVKTYRPLLDDETPDFADWVKRINETDTPEESEKFDA